MNTETISSVVSYSPEPSPDISSMRLGGQQDTGTACTLCTRWELLCPFCQACCAPPWKEAMTFTCSAGEQNFALDNKLLTGIDRLFFPLSCCLWPPHVCLLWCCVWGGDTGCALTRRWCSSRHCHVSSSYTPSKHTPELSESCLCSMQN